MSTVILDKLFSGEIEGIVAACSSTERPLQGLAGSIDWSFKGALSDFIRSGAITGSSGEIVYIPIRKPDRTFHFILVGVGPGNHAGSRPDIQTNTATEISSTIEKLGLKALGFLHTDLPGVAANERLVVL